MLTNALGRKPVNAPILQFGTSRFLLAHAALFVSEALGRGAAIGGITIVQTTQSASSRARIAALKDSHGYPVHIGAMMRAPWWTG
jgi:tagaturonate reductase